MAPQPSRQVAEFVTALRRIGPFAAIKQDGSCWRQMPFEHGYPPRIRCRFLADRTELLIGFRTDGGDVLFTLFSREMTDEQELALAGTLSDMLDFAALHRLLCPDAAESRPEELLAALPARAATAPWRHFDGQRQMAAERSTPGAYRWVELEQTRACKLRLKETNAQGAFKLTLNYRNIVRPQK